MSGFETRDEEADRRMAASNLAAYLPRVLLYPLRGHAAPVILVVTLLLGLGSASIVALVPLVVGTLWAAHYAMRVLEDTSYGHALPPRLTGDALTFSDGMTWSTLVAPGALLLLYLRQPGPAVWLIAALLPAHWIALGTTRSLIAACHPLRLLHIIAVVGVAYLFVCVLLLGAAALAVWMSTRVSSFLLIAGWLYLLIMACHLLGFVAYQRHERLGMGVHVIRPTIEREREAEQARRLKTLVEKVAALHAAHDDEAAARLMRGTPAGPADARRFHEDLYERLKALPARGLALTQAARMIVFLLDGQRVDRALDIFENALDLDARFQTESPLHLGPLAERALESRQSALLGRILDSGQARFAGDPALGRLDILRIRKLMDLDHDEAGARAAIAALGDFEGHPHAVELDAYARVLRTAGPAAPAAQADGPDDPTTSG